MNFTHQNKNSVLLNNNNLDMDKHASSCSKSAEDRKIEEFQNFIENPAENEDENSDENENPAINSDSDVNSYDDLAVSEDDDVQLSSPSNSLNSDVDQRWYAFRGRYGVNMVENNHNNNPPLDNRLRPENVQPQPPQEEEETDFLEMDFEPDTNSEIENEAKDSDYVPNGHQHAAASNSNSFNFHNLPLPLPHSGPDFRLSSLPPRIQSPVNEPDNFLRPANKNTGAKPKQLSTIGRPQKTSKQVSDGDDTFKISSTNNKSNCSSSNLGHSSRIFNCATNGDEIYNLGASSSRASHDNDRLYKDSLANYNHDVSFMKIHKSPSKSSNHHNHKHLRLHEEQNDQFLFEIEPIKPRNSVTIYTTNCDEKILIDALTSLNLSPNRELISSYFNRSKPSISTSSGTASNCELNLVDYLVYKSKLNCNYLRLIELIQKACKIEVEDGYDGEKKVDINFYPLDLFSTTPEMIEVQIDEIVQRWTPQTDISPLVNIRNKYFYQTNVLGKVVNIIRKINQKPPATFKDKETIKIPQFYVSGYITITISGYQPS